MRRKKLWIKAARFFIFFLAPAVFVFSFWYVVRDPAPAASTELITLHFSEDFDGRDSASVINQNGWTSTGSGTADWTVANGGPSGSGKMLSQTSYTANVLSSAITNTSNGAVGDSEVGVDFRVKDGVNPQIWLRRGGAGASAAGYLLTGPKENIRIYKRGADGSFNQISTSNVAVAINPDLWYTAVFQAINANNTVTLSGYFYLKGDLRPSTPTITATDTTSIIGDGYPGLSAHAGLVDYDNFALYVMKNLPKQPQGLTALANNARVDLTWTAPNGGDSPITDYMIEYRQGSDPFTPFPHLSSASTGIAVTGLTNGITYEFRVSAVSSVGTGSPSETVTATPMTNDVPLVNLKLWLRAGSGVYQSVGGATSTNDSIVGQWQDLSGSGNHLQQNVSTKKPSLIAGAINGQPGLRFDGIEDHMISPNSAANWKFLHDTTGFSTFFVMKTTDANPQAMLTLYDTGGEAGENIGSTLAIDDRFYQNGMYSPIVNGSAPHPKSRGTGNDLITPQTSSLVETSYLYGTTGDDFNLYVNGTKVQSQESASTPSSGNSTYSFNVGSMSEGKNYFFKGDIAEMLIFNSVLSSEIRRQVECYLANKYAISLSSSCSKFAPSAITDLSGAVNNGQVTLSWSSPTPNGSTITDYIVQYRPQGESGWAEYEEGIANTTKVTVTGLTLGAAYDFRVIPVNGEGRGLSSNIISITPYDNTPYAPTASGVTFSGPPSVGGRLVGSYVYKDANGDPEGTSLFRWLYANSSDGPYVAISGATSKTYRLMESEINKYIKFEVTPVSTVAPTTGTPTQSATSAIITSTLPVIHHILSTGQSLSIGSRGDPPISITQPYNNIMLSGSSFVPLVEGVTGVETISSAMANTLTALDKNREYRSLVSIHGAGASAYGSLKKGTPPYQKGLDQINAAVAAATSSSYEISAVTVIHGETDHIQGTTAEQYVANLAEWQANYESDAKAITSQTENVPLFTDQMGTWTTYNSATSVIPLAQFTAAKNYPTKIYLVGPKYFLPYSDGSHLTNAGYRRLGEYYGKVMKRVLIDREPWTPLSPNRIARSGVTIIAKFNVPVQPLVFDSVAVAPKINYGFEYFDDASSASISGVEVYGSDMVKISLSKAPTGDNQRLRYAFTGTAGVAHSPQNPKSAMGNLRDSDSTPSINGNSLNNWAVHFDEPIISDQSFPIISNIKATPSTNSVNVIWATNEGTYSIVEVGTSANVYMQAVTEVDKSYNVSNHNVTISALAPCTVYHYRVRSKDLAQNLTSSANATFSTAGCVVKTPSVAAAPKTSPQSIISPAPSKATSTADEPVNLLFPDEMMGPLATGTKPTPTPTMQLPLDEELIVPEPTRLKDDAPIKPPVPVYNFNKNMNLGAKGEAVVKLQTLLKKLGYYKYPIITGYFGPVTRQAVIKFQKAYKLPPYPGNLGPKTRTMMNKLLGE